MYSGSVGSKELRFREAGARPWRKLLLTFDNKRRYACCRSSTPWLPNRVDLLNGRRHRVFCERCKWAGTSTVAWATRKGEIMKLLLMASATSAALLGLVAAQTVAPPAFEVASIKLDDAAGNFIEAARGSLSAHSATLATCIMWAYGV